MFDIISSSSAFIPLHEKGLPFRYFLHFSRSRLSKVQLELILNSSSRHLLFDFPGFHFFYIASDILIYTRIKLWIGKTQKVHKKLSFTLTADEGATG